MIAMVFVSVVLMSSMVFAGITGQVVQLKEGAPKPIQVAGNDYIVSVENVDPSYDTTNVVVKNINTGETKVETMAKGGGVVNVAGLNIQVDKTESRFFGRPKATISVEATPTSPEPKCPSYFDGDTFLVNGHTVILRTNEDGSFYFDVNDPNIPLPSFKPGYTGSFGLYGTTVTIQDSSLGHVSICVEKVSVPTPTTGSCVHNCKWVFEDQEVITGFSSGVGADSLCGNDEIAFEGSCFGDGAYEVTDNHVVGPLTGAPNGNGWHCGYQQKTGIVLGPKYTLETGALCCSV